MNFELNDDQQAYIASARAFSDNELAPHAALWDAESVFAKDALKAAGELGFMGMYTPEAAGGLGMGRLDASLIVEELAKGCTTTAAFLTIHNMATAMIGKYCQQAVVDNWCPDLVMGEKLASYCLTEPGAGSDLTSLSTRAEDKGDHFVVSGTKIWTTRADVADWIFCLVRTDPDAAKRDGISFLLIDMSSEGVSTRPIPLISGESEFCQTFFDEVRVPRENLVGELNGGWQVAKELLKHERKLMATMESITEKVDVGLVELAKSRLDLSDGGQIMDGDLRSRITNHLMHADALDHLNETLFRGMKAGQLDPALPLTLKYIGTTEQQRKDELMLEILGADGLAMAESDSPELERMVRNWAYNKAHTIAGGTSEIQLNIIARRGLGLPE